MALTVVFPRSLEPMPERRVCTSHLGRSGALEARHESRSGQAGACQAYAMTSRRRRRQTQLPKGSTFHWFSSCWSVPTMEAHASSPHGFERVRRRGGTGHPRGRRTRRRRARHGHSTRAVTCRLFPAPPPPEIRRDVRDVHARRSRAAATQLSTSPRSPTIRWASSTRASPTRSTTRRASGSLGSLGRPVSSASSSHRRAACTAPRSGTGLVDETAPLAPLTAYASSKVRAERSLAELASDSFSPVFSSLRDRLRCLAEAAPRHRAQQSRGYRGGFGRRPSSERRHCLAAAHSRRGYGARLRRRARCAPGGRPRRGLQCWIARRELPHAGPRGDGRRRSPGLRSDVRRRVPAPTRAVTGSTSRRSRLY